MSTCCCGGRVMILPCSGAADVGEIADRAARQLSQGDYGDMFCLAGIGAGISGFVASVQGADRVITIDGCPVGCARTTVENHGVKPTAYVVTDYGFEKGKSPVTAESVRTIADVIRKSDKKGGACCSGDGRAATTAGGGCCG